jgi:hypothetical protein
MRWLFVLAVSLPSAGCESVFPLEFDLDGRCLPQGYEKLELEQGRFGYYRVDLDAAKWIDAELACRADGPTSHLAVLGSSLEIAVVYGRAHAIVESAGRTDDILIGLSKRSPDGLYHWVTDELDVAPQCTMIGDCETPPWRDDQPVEPNQRDTVELDFNSGRFITVPDQEDDTYVCECDQFPEDAGNL